MPDPCGLNITDVQSSPPYGSSGEPLTLLVRGIADQNCDQLIISVREFENGPVLFPNTLIHSSPQGAPGTGQQLWQASFSLNPNFAPHFRLGCGSHVYVEVHCANDETCTDSLYTAINCKDVDDTHNPPPPPPECQGIELPIIGCIPGINCLGFKRYFAFAVTVALIYFIASLSNPGLIAVASASLGLAVIFYLAMQLICPPSPCTLQRLLCWSFKWACLLGLLQALFSLHFSGIVLALVYGAIAGWLEVLLSRKLCRRPIMTNLPV